MSLYRFQARGLHEVMQESPAPRDRWVWRRQRRQVSGHGNDRPSMMVNWGREKETAGGEGQWVQKEKRTGKV